MKTQVILFFLLFATFSFALNISIPDEKLTMKNVANGQVKVDVMVSDATYIFGNQSSHFYLLKVNNTRTTAVPFTRLYKQNITVSGVTLRNASMFLVTNMSKVTTSFYIPDPNCSNISNCSGTTIYKNATQILAVLADASTSIPKKTTSYFVLELNTPLWQTGTFNFTATIAGQNFLADPDITACGEINAPGSYNLTQNVSINGSVCFTITANNVNFSGQGYTITGNSTASTYGIFMVTRTGGNFSNFRITGFEEGIFLDTSSTNNILSNNTLYNNTNIGIYLEHSSSSNVLTNNRVYNTPYGIYLYTCSNNNLTNNTVYLLTQNGFYLDTSSNDNILSNNTAYNATMGFYFKSGSNNNTITNNSAYNTVYGFYLGSSSNNNSLANNSAYSNTQDGFVFDTANNNSAINNSAYNNVRYGFYVYSSLSNNLINNTANSNGAYGFLLYFGSANNILINNTVWNNTAYQIGAIGTTSNLIYNNIFNATGVQGVLYEDGTNSWNTTKTLATNIIGGVNIGGNYYSNYTGTDTDGDGIGDTPYGIGSNYDYLPLTNNASDNSSPVWSSNASVIVSAYSSARSYFNITWTDNIAVNNNSVLFESNYSGTPTNYTMNNITTNGIYNYSAILPAGTWYWKTYANDTSNNSNSSDKITFTIAKGNASSLILYLNGTAADFAQNITFNSNFTCTDTVSGNHTLYENGTVLNSTNGTSVSYTRTYSALGYYNITCAILNHQNYTGSTTHYVNATTPSQVLLIAGATLALGIAAYMIYHRRRGIGGYLVFT